MNFQNQRDITFFFGKENERKVATDSPKTPKRKIEDDQYTLGTPGTPKAKCRRGSNVCTSVHQD